jgi:hypothetical protein
VGEEYEVRPMSRLRELSRTDSSSEDYLKLLRSKEDTIKELKDII